MDKPIGITPGLANLSADRLEPPKRDAKLGQEAFLELMVTQLKNQDPFKPMESGQFLGQIAQFGTVNGITELQQSFDTFASSLQSNQALQASTMVGREVMVDGATAHIRDGETATIGVDLPSKVGGLKLTIEDQFGQLIRQLQLGAQNEGITEVQWDGLDAAGQRVAPGEYSVKAEAVIDGDPVAMTTLMRAAVESVTLSRNGDLPVLNLRDRGAIALSDVRRVM